MRLTLKQIADFVQGEVKGDADIVITGVSGIKEAKEGDITFLANTKYAHYLEQTQASAVITSKEITTSSRPIIRTENPSLAFAKVVSLISPPQTKQPEGIHPSAILGKDVDLGKNVAIGAYTVVEDHASIGDNTIIYAGCYIGYNSKIGKDSIIYPRVTIREAVTIGNRVVIHSGSVIGSDGFGFVTIDGLHQRIPQIGTVIIQDDVEIGANVTIDRARFEKTIIGKGTKIDNLVQIAHNVVIGENSIIVAQAGISGSTTLGKNVIIAGQAGLVGHISIGDNVVVMAQSGVSKSIPPNTKVWGYPAKEHTEAKKVNACVQRLPHLYKVVEDLKKKIQELEEQCKKK
ncbi:MAG: UDP-3-O-(3-hydroxymyristoyl)glucosamine N-acyltransferase [Candidatus Omnitrophica bacterium]|nr:UDP-3-O-(3-hydroxymyristoyl)glucosamine N-acyltransferase [Candidatus Omnitrophota bacterium]